jgi:hypothetical protein
MTFLEILEHLGIPCTTEAGRHVRPGWVATDCMRCSPGSGKMKLGYHPGAHVAVCWTCGRVSLAAVLVETAGIGWGKAKELLKGLDDGDAETFGPVPTGKLVLPAGLGPMARVHRDYLRGRGFDPNELAKVWGLQGIGLAKRHPWSVFIPVHHRGRVVSWTTRSVHDKGRRYGNAEASEEAVRAKDVIFGIDHVRHSIVVVEGYLDAMKIGYGAGGTGGLIVTQAQVAAIAKVPNRTIMFDGEPEAQRVARDLAGQLSAYPGKTRVACIDAADPGSASRKEVALIRKTFL